ncbi:MAG TPA: cupredoxin domain-containing protein [Nitrososphaerales archaeon]|nr:cupredoxin domain-containing protein [Nitrososphaerales archaeon]
MGAVLCTNNQSATGTVTITIRDYYFNPRNVTISPGQSVQWLYSPDGNTEHTVTSNQGLFGSNNLPPGQKFTCTFNQAGTYGYHCSNHPAVMKGIVVVD